ncbi:class C beta-lactamase-related serine hydrolase [Neorhizobium sp. P12A]|uniref:serine hydrolase domain-containing protein n=1 Tax=Neorhizobium sp. P12A TaxID=2268027 RepID=UPI0011ED7549|nr:serine hydrolase [Neorhizobium sp. P12A]KAA0695412.1 class C beta-lactamase-related serine hydrolase [Neorhizobium sp. P12A]
MYGWRSTALAVVLPLVFGVSVCDAQETPKAGPVFSDTGPNAETYGEQLGYPVHWPLTKPENMVGDYSHFDQLPGIKTSIIAAAEKPSPLLRAPDEITASYPVDNNTFVPSMATLPDYLARNPATGLLIAHDQTILYEHYQYGRTDHDRFLSQSMAKTITAMLIGIAISEGAIHSVDDTAETYVPELKGTEIGSTPIRALLHMASGIAFTENYSGRDDNAKLVHLLLGKTKISTVEAVSQFNQRVAPPDTHWHYKALDPEVLGLVLTRATHMTMSEYLQTRIWQPMGAEASATWVVDNSGQEQAFASFSATLRDYARFGLLLAHDGLWNGHQIIPRQWILDATQPVEQGSFRAIEGTYGYGYLTWLFPGPDRMFWMDGLSGQRIIVDPTTHLVLVQTAVQPDSPFLAQAELFNLWNAVLKQFSTN